jgi:hypothetical protein
MIGWFRSDVYYWMCIIMRLSNYLDVRAGARRSQASGCATSVARIPHVNRFAVQLILHRSDVHCHPMGFLLLEVEMSENCRIALLLRVASALLKMS